VGDTAGRGREGSEPAATFDVQEWLAELTGEQGWQIDRTFTRRKVEFVTNYKAPRGATAEITMRAVPSAAKASWELRAVLGQLHAGVVIPAHVRVKW
jgi:hypothetical protein